MRRQKTTNTGPEIAIRSALQRAGKRFRVNLPVPNRLRRTIDIAFPARKVAIFIDGCFWHGCPKHKQNPRNNSEWWHEKLQGNRDRDIDTDNVLKEAGWLVLRYWEHDSPEYAVAEILGMIDLRNHPMSRQ